MNVKIQSAEQVEQAAQQMETQAESISNVTYTAPDESGAAHTSTAPTAAAPKVMVGRNEPCPCGSGKKYKHCHGKLV